MRDPIDQRSQSSWVDAVVHEAAITPFGHKASAPEGGQVLGDGRHLLIVKRPEGTGEVIATSEVGWRMLLFVVLPVAWLFGSRQRAVRIE